MLQWKSLENRKKINQHSLFELLSKIDQVSCVYYVQWVFNIVNSKIPSVSVNRNNYESKFCLLCLRKSSNNHDNSSLLHWRHRSQKKNAIRNLTRNAIDLSLLRWINVCKNTSHSVVFVVDTFFLFEFLFCSCFTCFSHRRNYFWINFT